MATLSSIRAEALEPKAVNVASTDVEVISDSKRRWFAIMDFDIGILPLPVYVVLVALLIAFTMTGGIKGEIGMVIGIMAAFAFTLGELGKRLPILRNIGAGAVLVTFVPSFLAYHELIPPKITSVVTDFFKSTNILSVFIAAVIVGSILSMDRTILIKGFAKIFAPLAAGSVVGTIVGTLVGVAVGIPAFDALFYIVVPIMSGGVGEGAIPLSLGYTGITGQDNGLILARILPAVMVGNLTAIILAGTLSYIGKRKPEWTGNGKLQPGNDDIVGAVEGGNREINVQNIAAAGMTAVTLYLCGVLAFQQFHFPAPVVMLFLAVLLKLGHMISPRLEAGSYIVYKFCLTAIAFPMLFAFGVALTPWDKLVEGFHPANLLTIVATVTSMVLTGFFIAKRVNLYPVEGAIVTSTHSGMGGAGDIAILTASNRMQLMPFAQIATRIGGGITVTLALIAMAAHYGAQ